MAACAWCRGPLPTASALGRSRRVDSLFCSKRCRQWAHRVRLRHELDARASLPMRMVYADPPYPGTALRYYGAEPTYAGEVDHRELVGLLRDRFDRDEIQGWALSTSAKALREVLPLCPTEARVCAWVKPHPASPQTDGLHNVWEPLIVVGGRQQRPGKRDALVTHAARSGGTLAGRKPIAFVVWLFQCLGLVPGLDTLEDLYPGTGVVERCLRALAERSRLEPLDASSLQAGDESLLEAADPSPTTSADTSLGPRGDASLGARGDASLPPARDPSRAAAGDPSPGAGVDLSAL